MLVPYTSEQDDLPSVGPPSWHAVHRFWLTLMEVYAADCARVGLDHLEASELRYRRSYVAGFMGDLIRARSCEEREHIIAEATQFLEQQEQKARRDPPAMKVVNPKARPALPLR
jgi:hypothetical protein